MYRVHCPARKLTEHRKSQLAIEYAYQRRAQSPETWILWLYASNEARFEQSVRGVLHQLRVRGRKDPNANIFELFHDWLCDATQGPWLVILDNADDARVLLGTLSTGSQAHHSVIDARLDCIPPCEHGQLLVTSRTASVAKELVDRKDIIDVEPMNGKQALTLLSRKLSVWYIEQHAFQLARELEFMPLALTQAAAYICESAGRCSIQQYLEKLRHCNTVEATILDIDERDLRRDRESSNSIILTWQISFDHIREMNPSAADLLSLMSFFDRQAIPERLLHTGGSDEADDESSRVQGRASDCDAVRTYASDVGDASSGPAGAAGDFEKDLGVLRNYHFVALTTDVKVFEMHRLVQLATKRWLMAHMQFEHWGSQFVRNLNENFPVRSSEFENWDTCHSLFPHAVAALDTEVTAREAVLLQAALLLRSGRYASAKGAYADAEKMLKQSVQTRKDVLGEQDLDTLTSVNNLARVLAYQGQWARAGEMWLGVVEQRKEKLGTDHQDTLTSMGNLADACYYCGRSDEAEKLQLEVLEKTRNLLGNSHEYTLISMNCLARTYSSQGRCEEAERLQMIVIERRKSTLGDLHPYMLISKSGLTWTYLKQGRYEEAERLQAEVIEKEKMVLGEGHPYTLISMDVLAWVYMKQGRWTESEELQLTVVEKRRESLIKGHPLTLTSMSNLAYMLRALGRRRSALDLMSSCVDLSPHVLGLAHYDAKGYSRVKRQWETEDSSMAGAEAACNKSDRPATGRARFGHSVRNAFAAMRFR